MPAHPVPRPAAPGGGIDAAGVERRLRRCRLVGLRSGLRRAEIKRLDWPDVELDGYRLVVRKAKSRAGTGRRPPIAEPLRPILLGESMRKAAGQTAQ